MKPAHLLLGLFGLRLATDGLLWRDLPYQYSYYFEIFLIFLSFFFFKAEFFQALKIKFNSYFAMATVSFFLLGMATHQLMITLGLSFPMDMHNLEMLLIALLVAPFIEEGIFRFLVWESLLKSNLKISYVILFTSVLFSFSHFLSYFYLTDILQNFILFQTAYTFILSILIGIVRFRTGSLTTSLWVHALYNLGFVVAFFL